MDFSVSFYFCYPLCFVYDLFIFAYEECIIDVKELALKNLLSSCGFWEVNAIHNSHESGFDLRHVVCWQITLHEFQQLYEWGKQ